MLQILNTLLTIIFLTFTAYTRFTICNSQQIELRITSLIISEHITLTTCCLLHLTTYFINKN